MDEKKHAIKPCPFCGGVNGHMIDVYFAEHWQCYNWETGYYDVYYG